MEVSTKGSPRGYHFRGFYQPGETLQQLLTPSGSHLSPRQSYSPSISPAADLISSGSYPNKGSRLPERRTLEGVLRGEVTSLFTDLCRGSPQLTSRYDITHQTFSSPPPVCRPDSVASAPSSSSSSSNLSPYSLKRSSSDQSQDQPIDLSCKKMRMDSERTKSLNEMNNYNSRLDTPLNSNSKCHLSPFSQKGPSLLRNLLCVGKEFDSLQNATQEEVPVTTFHGHNHNRFGHTFPVNTGSYHSNQTISSPEQLQNRVSSPSVSSKLPTGGPGRVTLAKKNMLPVSARVSDWLVKIIRFAKSIPEFASLLHNDKLALLLNSWPRVLMLYMAENNFQFAVAPDLNPDSTQKKVQCPESTGKQEEPTMKGVESIQTFIRKCQNMGTDSKEYAFLRMAVLFNAGIRGLDRSDVVDRVNSSVQQLLQQHVQACRPRDFMHYSRLLMSLPALYGINCKMIENLFCRHINGNMDMDVLLKEMLQNI